MYLYSNNIGHKHYCITIRTIMDFAFKKKNFILLITGILFIATGLILMSGGASEDPEVFNYEIFNFRRLTLAPILITIGFIIEIFAIMLKFKD